jgi:hypothetical protein
VSQELPASASEIAAAQLRRLVEIARVSKEETGEIAPDLWEHVDAATDELVEAQRAEERRA